MFHIYPTQQTQTSYRIPSWYLDPLERSGVPTVPHTLLRALDNPPTISNIENNPLTLRYVVNSCDKRIWNNRPIRTQSQHSFSNLPGVLTGSKAILRSSNTLRRLVSLEERPTYLSSPVSPEYRSAPVQLCRSLNPLPSIPSQSRQKCSASKVRSHKAPRKSISLFDINTTGLF